MSDILAIIDNAVGDRCACGCGRPLDPSGPSAWYAGEECQRVHMGRSTTRPLDVYRRPDAYLTPEDYTEPPRSQVNLRQVRLTRFEINGVDITHLLTLTPGRNETRWRDFTAALRAAVVTLPAMNRARRRNTDRRAYEHLTVDERARLHQWLIDHQVDPTWTPTDAIIELDPATNEWRIEQLSHRNGQTYHDPATNDVARHFVRRVRRSDLPWPGRIRQYGTAELRRHDDGTVTVEHADDIVGITVELYLDLGSRHRPDDETLILDTAGTYRYRLVDRDEARNMLIFQREGTSP